jgi:Zn-finger nucleic acid-binding protein
VRSGVLVACPACAVSSLVEFEARADVRVELCLACKGMLMDELALRQLTGTSDVEALSEPSDAGGGLRPCLRCNTANWRRRGLGGAARPGLGLCGTCGMVWFEAGAPERLRERLLGERRRARAFASGAPADPSRPPEAVARITGAASALGLSVAPSNDVARALSWRCVLHARALAVASCNA